MEESMKTRKNSITTNYIYNMIFQVLNLLLPFITTPYVSRVLKADNIGIYSYTYSIITTFVLVGSLGVAMDKKKLQLSERINKSFHSSFGKSLA